MIDELGLLYRALAGGEPPAGVRDALQRYATLVADWDARTDLTGARDTAQLVEILCADAFVLMQEALVPRGARVVDVGSGAGAPILPLLLLRSDLTATLVEPRRIRVAFLRTAIGSLPELVGRAKVVEAKLDLAVPRVDGMPFDVAMARATFAPAEWLRAGHSLAKRVVVMTATEQVEAPPDVSTVARVEYVLPRTNAPRLAVGYERH